MRKALFFFGFFSFIFLLAVPIKAEEFYYKHRTGDRYRILSTIYQDVYINRQLSHSSEIINRIAVEITGTTEDKGSYAAVFQTAERAAG